MVKTGVAVTLLTDNDADVMYDLKNYLESTDSAVPDPLKRHEAAQSSTGAGKGNAAVLD